MMRRALWCRSTLLIILLLLLMVPISSWGHAYLVKSSPARRAVLSKSPTRVVLWFNERLEAQFSQLSLWNAEGQQVDGGDVQVGPDDGKRLSVGLPNASSTTGASRRSRPFTTSRSGATTRLRSSRRRFVCRTS